VTSIVFKATGIWLLILFAAMANGILRDKFLATVLGAALALPLSGILLALIIFAMSWLLVPLIGPADKRIWLAIGLLWVALTLVFEYLFGYFVMGRSLHDISTVFKLLSGNLFLLVLFAAGLSPRLAAGLRGLVN
jgi:hypothetical protein